MQSAVIDKKPRMKRSLPFLAIEHSVTVRKITKPYCTLEAFVSHYDPRQILKSFTLDVCDL
jgi:Flp pilus assembly CpaF family ATPase